jgi:hypothetical protein
VIVAVGTWRGVGATTAALALSRAATVDGERPLLVEADPAGGVLAARIGSLVGGGLERVAFPVRRTVTDEQLLDEAIDVSGIDVLTGAGDPFRAWSCHQPRVPWTASLRDLAADRPVIVDVGRIRAASPALAILSLVDAVLVVSDADVVSITSALEWTAALGRVSPLDPALAVDTARLLVVDAPLAREPIRRGDATVDLGGRLAGWLPWSPPCVDQLWAARPIDTKRLRRSPLVTAATDVWQRLQDRTGTVAA